MSKHVVAAVVGGDSDSQHKYEQVPSSETFEDADDSRESRSSLIPAVDEHPLEALEHHLKRFKKGNRRRLIVMVMGAIGVFLFLYWAAL